MADVQFTYNNDGTITVVDMDSDEILYTSNPTDGNRQQGKARAHFAKVVKGKEPEQK